MDIFGKNLRLARELHGLNQAELSKKMGLKGYLSISRYERNERKINKAKLDMLEKVLDVSAGWLLTGEINKNYCYEISSTIRLNKISIPELSEKLSVRVEFLSAVISETVSPSTEFFRRTMDAIGVNPQENLKDNVSEKIDKYQPSREFLNFKIERLERDVAEREEYIETLLNEIQMLKLENQKLKKKPK
jgi:transcriptional regulator with XRE-family HTH domain